MLSTRFGYLRPAASARALAAAFAASLNVVRGLALVGFFFFHGGSFDDAMHSFQHALLSQ